MLQNILVPLDGSERAERALELAARLARATGGSLTLLQVIEIPTSTAWRVPEQAYDPSLSISGEQPRIQSYLRKLTLSEKLKGLPTTIEVMQGDPAHAILECAHLHQSSLIVMCSHGERGLTRWLFGSVSLKVARHSPIPVLVLRPDAEGNVFHSKTGTVRILVPLDGSARAEQALEPAAQLANALSPSGNGALHLACVIPYGHEDQEMLIKLAGEYLAEIEEKLFTSEAGKSLAMTTSISLASDVAASLVGLAANGKGMEEIEGFVGCDMIAMTTHGRSGVMRWVMGSVTERVLDLTRLPLFIVRVQEKKHRSEQPVESASIPEEKRLEQEIWNGLV